MSFWERYNLISNLLAEIGNMFLKLTQNFQESTIDIDYYITWPKPELEASVLNIEKKMHLGMYFHHGRE